MPGDAIDRQMLERAVGEADTIQGSLDGIQCNVWAIKDVGYTMKMMATGGNIVSGDSCGTTIWKLMVGNVEMMKEFIYPLQFDLHYWYRHVVDNHNNCHYSLSSWEDKG